ncbi:MAG: CHAT domain-containing protein [Armatimonadetes bacterium]|nr:CHAT domain-containing protein [Armatimonadota bacterium]
MRWGALAVGLLLVLPALGGEKEDAARLLEEGHAAYAKKDLDGAEKAWKAALAIDERIAPESAAVAVCLGSLANVASARGDLAAAEGLHRRALAIQERLAPDSLQLAAILENLGNLAAYRDDPDAAEASFKRALAIRDRLAPNSMGVANSLLNLGHLAHQRGDLASADTFYQRGLAILERRAPDSLRVAATLLDLGNVAAARGDLVAAAVLMQRALAIQQRLAPDSPDVAGSLAELGALAHRGGDLTAAEALLTRALAIIAELAPGSLAVASCTNDLGAVALDRGDLVGAEAFLKRALAIRERLAPDSLAIASCLLNLGNVAAEQGDLTAAESDYLRAAAIRQRLAPESLDLAMAWRNLSLVCLRMDRSAEALAWSDKAMLLEQRQLRQSFPALTDREKTAFLHSLWRGSRGVLSLAALRPREPGFVRAACDWTLRRKGIVLSALLEDRQALRLVGDEATAAEWKALQAARAGLSHLVVAGPGQQSVEAYRARRDELDGEIERLLKNLAGKSAVLRAQRVADEADCDQVCRALPPGSVLVEVVDHRTVNFTAKRNEPQLGPPRYVAFVLRPSEPRPTMLDLGAAEPIDRAVARMRSRLSPTRQRPDDGSLYDLVWSKIEPHLGGATRIYVSPDGQLNLLAFGALQDPTGKFLAESYTFIYLASGRDLLRPQVQAETPRWVVVSNPEFGGDPGAAGAGSRTVIQDAERTSLTGARISSLPGSKEEGEKIAALARAAGAPVEELAGSAATEAKIKSAVRPAVLHLATHGLFLPDVEADTGPDAGLYVFAPGEGPAPAAPWSGNPMHRSVLLLTGAAHSLEGAKTDGEDGILTAEEVGGMDLEGTRLVCLSACDTGLGEVHKGEGVMGLRRAFQLAGAESLVMSLWRVPDAETRDLMIDFYRRFTAGESAPDAMTAAQRAFIAARRAAGQSDAPFWWAGFVVGGR